MGYSLCWAAVRGRPREAVLADCALHGTGAREAIAESPLVGTQLTDGWYVVLSTSDSRFAEAALLERLSADAEVIAGSVEEHVMFSTASSWSHGKQIWSLIHDPQQSADHLEATGELPASFVAIRDRLRAQREFFEIPVELAKALTGFAYDEELEDDGFEVLASAHAPADTKKARWLKRLFSR